MEELERLGAFRAGSAADAAGRRGEAPATRQARGTGAPIAPHDRVGGAARDASRPRHRGAG